MPSTLSTPAIERGTYAITVAFTDDAEVSVTPNAGLTWSLYQKIDGVETVVNERLDVAITSAASITVVLSDLDLALIDGTSKTRYLLLEGTYDSTLGTDLPIKEQVTFAIVNLVGVS
jgi:hypothetical protein